MSLQFYLGGSGSGKSHALHRMITARADRERDRNFLFIVPDQFTMQTQIDLVNASEKGGILNVDVLSFGRLAHRIFEETGAGRELVLDDTGKNLILRSLAGSLRDQLPVLGKHLGRPGYIHEIKSVLSEFKQYDISSEKLETLIDFGSRRGMLGAKLKDLAVINEAFNNYTRDRFVTTEETMTLLTDVLDRSEIIRGSVVVFDGFTGFTPVQYRLISRLLELTERVIVSITVDINAEPYGNPVDQELFYLSKQTIRKLQDCARETNTRLDDDLLFSERYRFEKAPALSHLEQSVFRYPLKPCPGPVNEISITEAPGIQAEVRETCLRIRELVLEKGYTYRDIAVVCADLSAYADSFRLFAPVYDIPVFIDETVRLSLNPFTESLRSALMIVRDGFSHASVFHYLRCGAGILSSAETDRLDNYVLSCGIRGEKNYREAFTRIPYSGSKRGEEITEEQLRELEKLNESRAVFFESIRPLLGKKETAKDYAEALKDFIEVNGLENVLLSFSDEFARKGDRERSREYSQICGLIRDLLDGIAALLPDERVDIDEFIELFDAGLSEIDVGTLPGGVDRIIVGDTERSRLSRIRVLFLLGANDGNIPRANRGGGLISDIDREYLKKTGIPLSPTPREQICIQRFYLYLCMTKPAEALHISFSRTDPEGNTAKESYLVPMMMKLFPGLYRRKAKVSEDPFASVAGIRDGYSVLSEALRRRGEGGPGAGTLSDTRIAALARVLLDPSDPETGERTKRLFAASSLVYEPEMIPGKLAEALYGRELSGSISRIETFSACAYRHFLAYGIGLAERDERTIRPNDTGNIYHETLERFSNTLTQKGYTLADFPDEEGMRILREVLDEVCTGYHEVLFFGTKKSEYMIRQMENVLRRTVTTFRSQLQGGDFLPVSNEFRFTETVDLGNGAKMRLGGRIDRIDLLQNNNCNYIKIIDFKSGSRSPEMDSLYYGLQLQLPFYMRAALREFEKTSGGVPVKPGAMFYYHIQDPVIPAEALTDADKADDLIRRELRPTGIISSDETVLTGLDRKLADPSAKSLLIPASKNKDGSISAASSVLDEDTMDLLGDYAENYMKNAGRKILSGSIGIDPKIHRNRDACTYCAYKAICPYDEKTPGYRKTELASLNKEEAALRIRNEVPEGETV